MYNIKKSEKNDICNMLENEADQIIHNLWLGNINSAYNYTFLKTNNIRFIISICDIFDESKKYNNITYLTIPIKDEYCCSNNMDSVFDKCNKFIFNGLINNTGVLVHCKHGHHRSASVVIAFLTKYLGVDIDRSINYIRYIRPCALQRNTCLVKNLFRYNSTPNFVD